MSRCYSAYRLRFSSRLAVTFLWGLALANIGCGAMFNERTSVVRVDATPPGAKVYVDGLYVAQAPAGVTLTNAQSHSIDLEANGYQRQGTRLESRTSGGFVVLDCVLLLFFIVPGVIALAVDASTGDWNVLEGNHLSVRLSPSQGWQPDAVAPAAAPSPLPGCQYDAQCKGERICRAGQCVEPTPASAAPAAPGGLAPPPSTDQQQPDGH